MNLLGIIKKFPDLNCVFSFLSFVKNLCLKVNFLLSLFIFTIVGCDSSLHSAPSNSSSSNSSHPELDKLIVLANGGDPKAQYKLGCVFSEFTHYFVCCEDGLDCRYKEAIKYFEKAAK